MKKAHARNDAVSKSAHGHVKHAQHGSIQQDVGAPSAHAGPAMRPGFGSMLKSIFEPLWRRSPPKEEKISGELSHLKKVADNAKSKVQEWDQKDNVRKFRKDLRQKVKEEQKRERKRHTLKYYLPKAGIEMDAQEFFHFLLYMTLGLLILFSALLVWYFAAHPGYPVSFILTMVFGLWTAGFVISFFIVWACAFFVIDLMMFQRKIEIEKVLPDFLLLTSSNIKAGMTIDQALWFAVRPRFGVLAKEIEICAKEVMTGEDLKKALRAFSAKYDSPTLARSISLIIEGIDAGGKMGDLLTKIAVNLQESEITRREMAANVTTYVIFITFATIMAAPFLFALSTQMIVVVTGLTSNLDLSGASGSFGSVSVGEGGIDIGDFKIFVLVAMAIGSLFSAMIVSVIKNGNVKEGVSYIPAFIAVSYLVYFFANWALGSVFGRMF